MANPKFRNINDATDEYTWDALNVQTDPPVSASRDFQSYDHEMADETMKLVDLRLATERRMWECTWVCGESQMRQLRDFWEQGCFYLFPDSGAGTYYTVEWTEADFTPEWMPGGKYRLRATLKEAQ